MSVSKAKQQILDLLALVTQAAHDAIDEYEALGHDLPSLDVQHPLDSAMPTPKMKESIRLLEGSCLQLCTTLARPGHIILNRSMMAYEAACLHVVVKANIAGQLIEHPSGLSLQALAAKSNIAAGKLGSVLRLLAAQHCFSEIQPDVFANNRLSLTLVPSDHISHAVELLSDTLHTRAASSIYEALTDPVYGPTYEPDKSPVVYSLRKDGFSGNLFDFMKKDTTRSKKFSSAIKGYGNATGHMCVIEEFPWGQLPTGTTVCDLGGGIGNVSIALLQRFSNIKVVLQDLPTVISNSVKVWNTEYPETVAEGRITFTPLDFFKEEPVHDLDIYYLSQVIHNWSDEDSIRLLKSIRQAMGVNSRVFIHDNIINASHAVPGDFEGSSRRAPEPLLANYGGGSLRTYLSDINMLNVCNARERRLDEFVYLGKEAGLAFTKVWDFIENGIIEFRRAD